MNRKREAGPIAERDLDELRERGYVLVGGLLAPDEIAELIDETNRLIGTAPAEPGTAVDADGNPVEHPEDYVLPEGPDGVPVLQRINRPMWRSRRFLEAYGNPRIHRAAYQLYGEDMVPFDESIVKELGVLTILFAGDALGSAMD